MPDNPKKKHRALKVFLSFGPKERETNSFMVNEERDSLPLIKGKVRRKDGEEGKPS